MARYQIIALIALCLAPIVKSDEPVVTPTDWAIKYDTIFGGTAMLPLRAVFWRMEHLSRSLEQLETSIVPEVKDNFKFWYNAMTDRSTDNCRMSYLDELYNKLNIRKNLDKPNLINLFVLVQNHLVEVCSDLIWNSVPKLKSAILADEYLNLRHITELYYTFYDGQLDDESFVTELFHGLPIKGKSLEEVKDAWHKGSCRALSGVLDKNEEDTMYELIKIDSHKGAGKFRPTLMWTNFYTRVFVACKEIDAILPQLYAINQKHDV